MDCTEITDPIKIGDVKIENLFSVVKNTGEDLLVLDMEGIVKTCGREFVDWNEFWMWFIDKLEKIERMEKCQQ